MRLALLLWMASGVSAETLVHVNITGNWRYLDGDSPAFASPDYDDSTWKQAPQLTAVRSDGVRWWRRRAVVPPGAASETLYLTIPKGPEAYKVFVNGTLVGTSGNLSDLAKHTVAQPRTFAVPVGLIKADGSCLIAIRDKDSFFLPPNLALPVEGEALLTSYSVTPFQSGLHARRKQWVRDSPALVMATFLLAMAFVAVAAWFTDRRRVELLWFALLSLTKAAFDSVPSLILLFDLHPFNRYGFAWSGLLQTFPICSLWLPCCYTIGYAIGAPCLCWSNCCV